MYILAAAMPDKQHYIYITTNNQNGKRYIGQHVTQLEDEADMLKDRYYGSGTLLLKALKKYGRKNFTKSIAYIAETQEEADFVEVTFIRALRVLENRDGWYNRAAGGQYDRSEDHSALMSQIMKEVANRPDVKRKVLESMVLRLGYFSVEEWEAARQRKKLKGLRVWLINTLKARRNQMNKEYLKTNEGRAFQKKYLNECRKHVNKYQYHTTNEDRKKMSLVQRTRQLKKAQQKKYTSIQLDMLCRHKSLTTRDAAKIAQVDETLLGQMRRGVQKMKGRWVPRYVRDEVFEAIQNA